MNLKRPGQARSGGALFRFVPGPPASDESESQLKSMSVEVKVLVVGPSKSGKTAISNFISDAIPNAENPALAPSKPTVGCRILEFERQVKRGTGMANVSIELWDVSGDRKYEDTWPAIRHNGIGIIFVYDGDKSSEELDNW